MEIHAISGLTACLGNALVAIGGTASQMKTTNAVSYCVDGIALTLAATAAIVLSGVSQAAGTACFYLVQVNAAGTVSVVQGDIVLTSTLASNGVPVADVQIPSPDAGNAPIGGVLVENVTNPFVPATTLLSAAGVTDTYFSYAGGMPGRPQTS
jgi:hypothetical protein